MVALVTTIVIVMIVLAMISMAVFYALNYHTIPPNKAMVLRSRRRTPGDGPVNFVSGGGRFILPGSESYQLLDLSADLVEFEMDGIETTFQGAPIKMRLKVAAIWKITTDRAAFVANVEKLVDRTRGENQMLIKDTLERAIRNVAASATLEEIETDRDMLAVHVQRSAVKLQDEMGLEVRSFVILKVRPIG